MWSVIHPPFTRKEEQDAFDRAMDEIDDAADRSAAIMAASLLETHLEFALKARLIEDEKQFKEVFRSSGPLGSFSMKIRFCFLMGICSADTMRDLEIIKDIRNAFAHDVATLDFEVQRIRDLSNNLTSHRHNVRVTADDGSETEIMKAFNQPAGTAREKFIRTCQILMFLFFASQSAHERPSEPQF